MLHHDYFFVVLLVFGLYLMLQSLLDGRPLSATLKSVLSLVGVRAKAVCSHRLG